MSVVSDTEETYFDTGRVVDTPKKGAPTTDNTVGGFQGKRFVSGEGVSTAHAVGTLPPSTTGGMDPNFMQQFFSGLTKFDKVIKKRVKRV
jgi:hypothetical protein